MGRCSCLGAVLMASGLGRRFGSNKLLREVEGRPMICRAFEAVPARLFHRAAVVSACPEILALAEEQGYLPIYNPRAAEGQSASVRLGLWELMGLDGALFAVCDQPWLGRRSVERLIGRFSASPDRICALSWQGKRGNPVIFPNALFPELMALSGDRGGGAVLRANPHLLSLVEADSPQELRDVDTIADLNGGASPYPSQENPPQI